VFGSILTRRRLALTGLASAALAALAIHPTWARALGVDVWNVPALTAQMRDSDEQGRRIEEESERIRRRLRVKETIVTDLIAGRVTLAEATDRFTELNESQPHYLLTIRNHFPGQTDEERMARNVIGFAEQQVPPKERPALRSRFEAELRRMLAASPTH
jgi:hypothetical protein